MSGDLRIGTFLPPLPVPQPTAKPAVANQAAAQVQTRSALDTSGVATASTITLDPTSGWAVQEYFDSSGILTSSIPSRQQLQAYQFALRSGTAHS